MAAATRDRGGPGSWLRAVATGLALSCFAAAAANAVTPATAPVAEGIELIMVEQPGCQYCAQWRAEIMPAYAQGAAGAAAPLRVVQLAGPWPDGLALGRRPAVTPTFILVRGGAELSRVEGYPGKDVFWPLLAGMLDAAGIDVTPARASAGTGG